MASNSNLYFPDFSVEDTMKHLFDDSDELFSDIDIDDLSGIVNVFHCPDCSKVYKTKSGLSRHQKSKHFMSNAGCSRISCENLKNIIEDAAKKLSEDFCFAENTRSAFSSFSISCEDVIVLWGELHSIFDNFKGNAEKFYSAFYGFIQPNCAQLFPNLSRFDSTLLSTEVANLCLKTLIAPADEDLYSKKRGDVTFTDRDIASLEYLSGYCFRTVYARLRNSPNHRSSHSQKCMSILQAGKCDGEVPQQLVDIKDRGGLWKFDKKVIEIFKVCEIEFQIVSSGFHKKIDAELLVSKLLKDVLIRTNFDYICGIADLKVEKNLVKDLLYNLLLLYIRVRCHSYATQLKEKHKQEKKEGKQKSLRTTIKKRSNTTELGH